MSTGYVETADILMQRITALIPNHPEILEMESAWDLFDIAEFQCSDLQSSLAQAQWALAKARSGRPTARPILE